MSALTALSLSRSAILGCRRYHKYLFLQPLPVRRGRAAPAPSRRAEQRAERRTAGTGGPGGVGSAPLRTRSALRGQRRAGTAAALGTAFISFFFFLFPFFSLLPPSLTRPEASGRGAAPTPSAQRPGTRTALPRELRAPGPALLRVWFPLGRAACEPGAGVQENTHFLTHPLTPLSVFFPPGSAKSIKPVVWP